jgi:hypothetical protein
MMQMQNRLETQRNYTIHLVNQLTAEYPALKPELQQIAEQFPGGDDEFAVAEELELLIVSICGYAQQIQEIGSVQSWDRAITHLQQLPVLANSTIAQFVAEAQGQYPKVQIYLQMLDYLRLLTLEYLQMQPTIQPISA